MDKKIKGCSLKKHALKKWIYKRGYTQPLLARVLKMDADDFKQRLSRRELFSEEQIRRLVYFMGAKSAFDVIYFATPEERERVRKATFGAEENKAHGRENRTKNAQ